MAHIEKEEKSVPSLSTLSLDKTIKIICDMIERESEGENKVPLQASNTENRIEVKVGTRNYSAQSFLVNACVPLEAKRLNFHVSVKTEGIHEVALVIVPHKKITRYRFEFWVELFRPSLDKLHLLATKLYGAPTLEKTRETNLALHKHPLTDKEVKRIHREEVEKYINENVLQKINTTIKALTNEDDKRYAFPGQIRTVVDPQTAFQAVWFEHDVTEDSDGKFSALFSQIEEAKIEYETKSFPWGLGYTISVPLGDVRKDLAKRFVEALRPSRKLSLEKNKEFKLSEEQVLDLMDSITTKEYTNRPENKSEESASKRHRTSAQNKPSWNLQNVFTTP